MSFIFKNTNKVVEVADFITNVILNKLKLGKRVLFFVTGGSSIAIGVEITKILKSKDLQNLTVMLTDERYGPTMHFDSNFFQLKEKGFDFGNAKVIPILIDEDVYNTTKIFNKNLEKELEKSEYKIGLFGIGVDGHTAGILPESEAVFSKEFAVNYDTLKFHRITITEKTIEKLDEAIVFVQGEEKKEALENLEKNIDINLEPAQILKKVPLLTIFIKI